MCLRTSAIFSAYCQTFLCPLTLRCVFSLTSVRCPLWITELLLSRVGTCLNTDNWTMKWCMRVGRQACCCVLPILTNCTIYHSSITLWYIPPEHYKEKVCVGVYIGVFRRLCQMAYLNNLLMVVAAENVTLLFAQCLPSMLLGGWQEGHPACKKLEYLVFWWRWSDWSFACLTVPACTTATAIISCCVNIQNGLMFWCQLTQVVQKYWPLNEAECVYQYCLYHIVNPPVWRVWHQVNLGINYALD